MRKLAALLVVGVLLALTGQARAVENLIVICRCNTDLVLAQPCHASTGVTIPSECDAAGDPCAECTAILLNEGFKLKRTEGDGSGVQYLFIDK